MLIRNGNLFVAGNELYHILQLVSLHTRCLCYKATSSHFCHRYAILAPLPGHWATESRTFTAAPISELMSIWVFHLLPGFFSKAFTCKRYQLAFLVS